eukprot:Rhum_TRINITY_DN8592_c0_g2::Rhum_TRINITY_DN8592_c0_g2_i1::g.28894::m.28894/K03859/PIGC, GPI2; phosphatidylinositol glycan, class C
MGRKPAQAGQLSGSVKPLDERLLTPRPSNVASPALSSRSDASETWRRVLWDNADGHEDCHVDEASFLQGLKMNYYAEVMEYWDIVWSTMALTQQCALVVTYLLCFFDLHQGGTSSATLTAVSSVLFALSFVFGGVQTLNAYESAATAVLLMFFTPVLASLTKAWTDDTLTAMCVLFLFVHVASSDYRTSASRERESAIASSSALFTSVLLASRLQRPSDAFVMIMLGVVTFIVAEEPRRRLRVYSPYTWGCLTLLLHVVGSLWLSQRSTSLAALYSASILLITFVVPTYFRYLQKVAKQQISGPWDEARPKNSLAAAQWATAGLIGRTR